MKIALDVRPLSRRPSGVGQYIRNLLRAFVARPEGMEFLLFHHEPDLLVPEIVPSPGSVARAPLSHESHPWGDLWRDYLFPRALRGAGVGVLHGPAFMLPRDRRGFATVVTIHDLVAFLAPKTVPWQYSAYMRMQIHSALRRADRVIAISHAERAELLERAGAPPDRTRVVYHGVEPRFRPVEDPESARRALAGLGITRPYLLHLGNIEPRKNLERVFDAHERIARETSGEVLLVVAGAPGWLCREIYARARRMPEAARPLFTNYVPDRIVPALLGCAEAFLFPSLYEGFGLPILEAMACGAPVVTSDRGAMLEISGGAAVLVDPNDAEAIAEGTLRVLRSPEVAAGLRAAGLRRAAEFTWERTARDTMAVYREAAG